MVTTGRQFMLAALFACSGLPLAGCDGGAAGGSLPLREIEATNKRMDALERRMTDLEARVAGGASANPEASDAARNNP
jgi:hypothetical protein